MHNSLVHDRLLPLGLLLGMVTACRENEAAPKDSAVFRDIAREETSGITYRHVPSVITAPGDPPPMKGEGAPGVAVFDYDRDGDLDIYASNGPGMSNALYVNQLVETGELRFVDRAEIAGVAAREQDSTGVCFGDIDNDGDHDLLVLGNSQPNRLFENRNDGTFEDITAGSHLGDIAAPSMSCSMGDVDGDGLLDIVVATTFEMTAIAAITHEPFALNFPNQLFLNRGNNVFSDESSSSGITRLDLPTDASIMPPENAATISWAIALVDYDLDGDVDLVHADDQGDVDNTAEGGINRGMIHVLKNDGTGRFDDVTFESGLNREGGWMGLAFADLDRNGRMDMFGANFGNHAATLFNGGTLPEKEENDTRWFLQQADGTFRDSFDIVGRQNSPFAWGVIAEDYDNDGDSDVIYYGGLNLWLFVTTNPGVVLNNDGRASFVRDKEARSLTDHVRRAVEGVAGGDFNRDGFVDIVSVSSFNLDAAVPLMLAPPLGGEWDAEAFYAPISEATFAGTRQGTMSIEINDRDNGNASVQVTLAGTRGVTSRGRTNRDGIGAVVRVRAEGSDAADMRPVLGGASYASQSSLTMTFGLGAAARGDIEVIWTGGARNVLRGAARAERIVFPEIPCGLDATWTDKNEFTACVDQALSEIRAAGVLDENAVARFRASMIAAFDE